MRAPALSASSPLRLLWSCVYTLHVCVDVRAYAPQSDDADVCAVQAAAHEGALAALSASHEAELKAQVPLTQ